MKKAKSTRPEPPEDLNGEALAEFHRVVSELEEAGTLDKCDRAVLEVYCRTWGAWNAAAKQVARTGAVIKYSNGMVGPSPFHKVAKENAQQLRALLNDLGLTPASRTGSHKPEEEPELEI